MFFFFIKMKTKDFWFSFKNVSLEHMGAISLSVHAPLEEFSLILQPASRGELRCFGFKFKELALHFKLACFPPFGRACYYPNSLHDLCVEAHYIISCQTSSQSFFLIFRSLETISCSIYVKILHLCWRHRCLLCILVLTFS